MQSTLQAIMRHQGRLREACGDLGRKCGVEKVHAQTVVLRGFVRRCASVLSRLQGAPTKRETQDRRRRFWRLDGRRDAEGGVNRQHQVNPLHVYDELRPKPYRDGRGLKELCSPPVPCTMKLKTDAGLEGLYVRSTESGHRRWTSNFARFTRARIAAGETLWDQMHR